MPLSAFSRSLRVGDQLPDAGVAEVVHGRLIAGSARTLMGRGRVMMVGVVSAFGPVCSGRHLPPFVRMTAELRRGGVESVFVVVPDSPWTVDRWADQQDPDRALRWISDGNLAFGRAAGLCSDMSEHLMGRRLNRFLMIVRDGVVEALHREPDSTDVTCTGAASLLRAA